MKFPILFTVAALVSASAQVEMKQSAAVAAKPAGITAADKAGVPQQAMTALEKEMDGRLSATGAVNNDPSLVLGGGTRGVYISGFGAVFTADLDLVNTPLGNGLFAAPISAEMKANTHKRKLAHVPMLQQTMRDMLLSLAASPSLKIADNDQIVLAVRLMYRPWEDTKDLPSQILMRIDRRGSQPKVEVQ
jgi:hypothetical protein